ncbi:MAG: hypothetical protein ACK5X2_11220 [Gemmatimonadaceae bacterium]|jgi:hypothetical protein
MFPTMRHVVTALGVLSAAAATAAQAQTITGITGNGPGGILDTADGGGISNVYVTAGTNPTTDAFLYNGNALGFFPNQNLTAGLYTFYALGGRQCVQANVGDPEHLRESVRWQ